MGYIPLEQLLKDSHSLFRLVMAAAKRSTELSQGAVPLVQPKFKKVTSIAMQEIAEGKVRYEVESRAAGEVISKRKDKDSDKEASA